MLSGRFNAFAPFDQLRREISHLLDEFDPLGVRGALSGSSAFPAVNVWECGEYLCAEAEVPGVTQDNIEVLVVGNELTIKGHRPTPEEKDVSYHRRERGAGDFARVLTLPVEIEADKVEASLKDGVLTLKLPKAAEARARKITVKTS
jgi:HSP20 family protein